MKNHKSETENPFGMGFSRQLGRLSGITLGPPPAGLTVRQQVDGLKTGVTPCGRVSAATLKVFGVDTPPTGITVSATIVTNSSYSGDLVDWDFNGRGFTCNTTMGTVRNCILRQTVIGSPLYLVSIGLSGSVAFEYCSFQGVAGNFDGVGTVINASSNNTDGFGFAPGDLRSVRYCSFIGFPLDHIKFNGSVSGTQLFEWNYHAFPENLPYAPAAWLTGTTYAAGDIVYSPTSGSAFVYRSLSSGNIGNTPPTTKVDNAFWQNLDPHSDAYTSVAAVAPVIIRNNLIDWTFPTTGKANVGLNNALRISRNTGKDWPIQNILMQENVLYHNPLVSSYPIQVASGVVTNFNGPIQFVNNWLTPNSSGSYFHPSSNYWTDVWLGNKNTATDAAVTGPILR